jgi:hypothetical protein
MQDAPCNDEGTASGAVNGEPITAMSDEERDFGLKLFLRRYFQHFCLLNQISKSDIQQTLKISAKN